MRGFFAALLLLTAACAPGASLKRRAEAVLTIDRNSGPEHHGVDDKIAQAAARILPGELAAEKLRGYDVRTLEVLFEALETEFDRLKRPELIEPLEAIFSELLHHRNGHVFKFPDTLFRLYVETRDWSRARKLYELLPSDSYKPPAIEGPETAAGPAVYEVAADGKSMRLSPVDLSRPMIVMVVGCHFASDALQAIKDDPELSRAFVKHALLIDPSTYSLDPKEIADANRAGPFHYAILYKSSGWPMSFDSMPTFYLMKDGRPAESEEGWGQEKTLERLRAWARELESSTK